MMQPVAPDGMGRLLWLCLLVLLAGPGLADNGFTRTDSGLMYRDIVVGTGPSAEPGDVATVVLVGWLGAGDAKGRFLYDTRAEEQPVSFVIGTDRIIRGWNEGVTGMRAGGKRLLRIPPALGFGRKGSGRDIPPDSTLIFELELLELEQR